MIVDSQETLLEMFGAGSDTEWTTP